MIRVRLEKFLFASRWLLVPFYFALMLSLAALLFQMGLHVYHIFAGLLQATEIQTSLDVLGIIDTTLVASSLVLIIFSGYENFVSRVDADLHANRPKWMSEIDFSGLKHKLMATIIAITAIHLLRAYIEVEDGKTADLTWSILLLLAFAFAHFLISAADWIKS